MGHNIDICCNGTSNEFGGKNTNFVSIVELLDRTAKNQLVYYDPAWAR